MRYHIISIFPKMLDSYLNESILKRAQEKKIISIEKHDLRDWTHDKHRSVDDTPYGGGAGMLMKVEPIALAIADLKSQISASSADKQNYKKQTKSKCQMPALPCLGGPNAKCKVVLLSAKGKTWTQAMAKKYAKLDDVIFICGRYEGVDERVLKFIDEEVSIGDYVLTGGELGAAIMIDSITRLLPGVLGNDESSVNESHSSPGVLEYPQYTRPEVFEWEDPSTSSGRRKMRVPKILLGGNHAEIEKWRRARSKVRNVKRS